MLRKMFTLLALVVVAVAFGVGTASAATHANGPAGGHGKYGEGFSDGRGAN